jgi:uncharacterized Zn ribbon protein
MSIIKVRDLSHKGKTSKKIGNYLKNYRLGENKQNIFHTTDHYTRRLHEGYKKVCCEENV